MDKTKPWYASSGVWGGFIAVLSPLLGVLFHVSLSDADATAVSDALATLGGAIGGIVAVYGRVKASSKISSQ